MFFIFLIRLYNYIITYVWYYGTNKMYVKKERFVVY